MNKAEQFTKVTSVWLVKLETDRELQHDPLAFSQMIYLWLISDKIPVSSGPNT